VTTSVLPMRRLKGMMLRLPLMLTCEEFEAFIDGYIDDELSASERRRFEWHIRLCKECRDYIAAYQAARELSIGVGGAIAPNLPEVPDDLVDAIVATRQSEND